MDTKICTKCKVDKSLGEFQLNRRLADGRSYQCGTCLREAHKQTMLRKPHYYAWRGMMNRCNNPNSEAFANYGGRKVVVCEQWLRYAAYEAYVQALGPKPSPKHTLDRIDNDKGYEPGNLQWADRQHQALNQRLRKTNKSGHKGVSWCKEDNCWVSTVWRNGKQTNLGHFKDIESAAAARSAFLLRM